MHLVVGSCVVIAFSNSSKPPVFFNFFTKLFTAFSLHLSSPSPFFHPKSRFTIGGVNGSIDVIATLNPDSSKNSWLVLKSYNTCKSQLRFQHTVKQAVRTTDLHLHIHTTRHVSRLTTVPDISLASRKHSSKYNPYFQIIFTDKRTHVYNHVLPYSII